MTLHTQDITARLTRYLDRKSMPRRLEGKPVAMQDELRALVAAVERNAPRDADKLADWWPLFEAKLGELTSAMWPVEKELSDAARAVRGGPVMVDLSGNQSLDPAVIVAKRMQDGKAYPETALYGIVACEMIARGLVDHETMTKCRSAAFFRRKDVYGEESALKWEAERKAAHEASKVVWRDKSDREARRMPIPDMTSKPQDFAA